MNGLGSTPANPSKGHRLFAAFYERQSVKADKTRAGPRRARLVGDLRGTVLEIGAGNGLNLAYYRNVDRLVALEPDPHMLKRLRRRAQSISYLLEIVEISAENLPFPDRSFDAVVASLVLCSVGDQARVLSEIRRVLKPGGELRFMEHVRADGFVGTLLDALTPLWSMTGGGCHPNRRTESAIRSAGFDVRSIEHYREGLLPHIQGSAKPNKVS
jgi:ubiquinone/menaquinone biosynthesis C-methylase UbiE